MRARLRLVEKCVSAQNSLDRLLKKFNAETVAELNTFYQLQAACHQAQIDLLEEQIATLERALHPHLIPQPTRLTDSRARVTRLIGKPGVVPTMDLGSSRSRRRLALNRRRVAEPIMVFGRHRV